MKNLSHDNDKPFAFLYNCDIYMSIIARGNFGIFEKNAAHRNKEVTRLDIEKFFRETMGVSDSQLVQRLAAISEPVYLAKGDLLVRQGERQEDFLFLVTGIFRGFYLDIQGREITDCFGFKPGTPGMSATINNAISPISIEAATECVFVRVPGAALLPLITSSPLLLKIYNEILQTAMQIHWELKIVVSQRPALERYQWFVQSYPGLIDRISDKHIASYLGMSPVTFSRIRRTMREQG